MTKFPMRETHSPLFPTIAFSLAFALWLWPVWSVRIPPLVDYPNHLARMHLLFQMGIKGEVGPFYEIRWAVLPNLAMDIVVPHLARSMSVETAGKVFISMVFLMLTGGTIMLHRALFGQWRFWPLIAFLFLYSRPFLWGFLNFLFGLGFSFWLLAGWIAGFGRTARFRLAVFVPLTLVLFFCHLFALGIYGLLISGLTLHRHRKGELARPCFEWAVAMTPFILPALLFLFASPTGATEAIREIRYGSLTRKLTALFQPVNNYHRVLDGGTWLFLTGLLIIGFRKGTVRIAPLLRDSFVFLTLFFLLMPEVLLTVMAVDTRMPIAVAFLLAAGTEFHGPRRQEIRILCLLLLLGLIRLGVVGWQWEKADRVYEAQLATLARVEPGSRLFSAVFFEKIWEPFPVPVNHLPCLMVARSVFVPSLFAYPTQQPIRFAPEYRPTAVRFQETFFTYGKSPDWSEVRRSFDFVWLVRKTGRLHAPPEEDFSFVAGNETFQLWKVVPWNPRPLP